MQVTRGKEQLTSQTSHPSAHFIGPLDGWDFGDSNRGMARGEWWRCVKKKKKLELLELVIFRVKGCAHFLMRNSEMKTRRNRQEERTWCQEQRAVAGRDSM